MTTRQLEQRFEVPLYSLADAARHIAVPRTTFDTWVRGYERRDSGSATLGKPISTVVGAPRGEPRIPFIGLAEGFVLAAFRAAGVPLRRMGEQLHTDGAEVLDNLGSAHDDRPEG